MKKADWDEVVVIALGSNREGTFGSTRDLLEAALEQFGPEGLRITHRSSWWRSAAWPDPTDPPFLNGVVFVETALEPRDTLDVLHRIERTFGRDRTRKNAPRTLDLDLIAYGRVVMDDGLVLPHPRAEDRRFVMGPLSEIAPEWRHPVSKERANILAATSKVGLDCERELEQ